MKIALLGDSIRLIGYGTKVPAMLGEAFEVYQPSENCRFSKYTQWCIHDWCKKMDGCRIIHWNNGLWDVFDHGNGIFSSEEEYLANMLYIADRLLAVTPNVIFATTTPVTDVHPNIQNADIVRYNEMIVPELQKKGILINDLHALVAADVDRYIRKDDNIHLTEAGIDVCAHRVVDVIKKVASQL